MHHITLRGVTSFSFFNLNSKKEKARKEKMMEIYDDTNKNNKRRYETIVVLPTHQMKQSVKLWQETAGNLSFEEVSGEFGVVDGSFFALFLSNHEGIDILLLHLLANREKDVSQFSSEDGTVGFLVEDSQTLDEVFECGGLGVLLDLVEDWHVFFKGDELGSHVFFGWVSEGLCNFSVGWVLSEGTDHASDRGVGDLAFTTHIEKSEHFFVISELCFSVVTHVVDVKLTDCKV